MPPMLPMRPLSSIAPKGGTKLRTEAITWLHAQVGGANGQAYIWPAIHLDTIHCIQIVFNTSVNTMDKDKVGNIGKQQGYHKISVLEQWINDKDIARDHSSPHRIKFPPCSCQWKRAESSCRTGSSWRVPHGPAHLVWGGRIARLLEVSVM